MTDHPTGRFECGLFKKGFCPVVGTDEVGRGAIAGPVLAAAVLLTSCKKVSLLASYGIRDSKKTAPRRRKILYDVILDIADKVTIGIISPRRIDNENIFFASLAAMRLAIKRLEVKPGVVLIDGPWKISEINCRQHPLVRGEQRSAAIAAASIIAKVSRDEIMRKLHLTYPVYQFARHKGYSTEVHRRALANFGPCPLHRRSFSPLALQRGNY